ncbi:MAG: nucleotidyltransferase domain-containing protein [Candidatus Levybacteria bacterium]|nr:nucleotidyltransferase domain-containing protein [Candidatus Levybacteria bacterium]
MAIRRTLLYSDIFDYPLTLDELYTFLLTENHYTKSDVEKTLRCLPDVIKTKNYYTLKKREHLSFLREQKRQLNEQKIQKAKDIIKKISFIPTILFIGISGSVAMHNAKKDDDIDFFVITKKDTIWMSRLLLIVFLLFFGMLRTRLTKKLSNTICLNMLIDETALSFPKERQDLYTAHEIVQLMPILERNEIYMRFLQKNKWILTYMPYSLTEKKKILSLKTKFLGQVAARCLSFSLFEFFAKKIQTFYMHTHITNETISTNFLAFHPMDYRERTLILYEKKIKKYV